MRARLVFIASLAVASALTGGDAQAGPTLERLRASGIIHCGAIERPGLFEATAQGTSGLLADLCRAIGVAAFGPSVKVETTVYDSEASFATLRDGRDDIAFLSGGETEQEKLTDRLIPGPPVAFVDVALMVPRTATVNKPADLASQPICFLQGDAAHRALEAYFAQSGLSFLRMGYQEEDELHDAFDAGQCRGLVGEATTLASVRLAGQNNLRGARILAQPLARFPILAFTNRDDQAWSALVAWTIDALVAGDRPKQAWSAGNAEALPLGDALGLRPNAVNDMLAATGGYSAMVLRNLGDGSPLALPPGDNALVERGGLLTPPYSE
ncbi:MAG: transporter substrate-binding domain-containing protein [Bradyrhizobium sp.]|nr:MAG: transporter substrate-binding domain-containing protein [Bradyrhizobium sp.]